MMSVAQALKLVLDHVDYTAPNCSPTDMVAAALPTEVITMAREALEAAARDRTNND